MIIPLRPSVRSVRSDQSVDDLNELVRSTDRKEVDLPIYDTENQRHEVWHFYALVKAGEPVYEGAGFIHMIGPIARWTPTESDASYLRRLRDEIDRVLGDRPDAA